ncbi:MAG TPA: hypothetical protein VFM10_05420 [Terriglobales bacterium]|jgi:hypothetical protein|nr:hypothetical protein [Terriglobales bacterium]
MRVKALVGVLLFIFLVAGAAAAASDGQQSSAAARSQKYDLFQCSTATSICNQIQAPNEQQQIRIRKPTWQFHGPLPQGGTVPGPLLKNPVDCYTMRTYTVAREDNTDSTRPAGYTTCVPGSKVQVKNATPNNK